MQQNNDKFKHTPHLIRIICSQGIVFLTLCITPFHFIQAEPPEIKFQHLSLEKGISHNLTYAILQDKAGFMWFGTLFGLVKYDGRTYEVFRNDPFDSTSISKDDIISIYEDSKGRLWVGTYGGGLNLYIPDKNRFLRIQHQPRDSTSLSNDIVWAISEDRFGQLWVGTENGLNRLKVKDGRTYSFTRYFHDEKDPSSLLKDHIRDLFLDSRGRFWIGTQQGGLHLYLEHNDSFLRLDEKHSVGSNNIVEIFEDSQSNLWLATWGGGLKQVIFKDTGIISKRTIEFVTYASNGQTNSISSNNVWSIEEDEAGNLWIGTYNGLNFWNRKTELFSHYKHDYSDPNSLSSNYVSAIYEDRSGVFWIGTFRGNIDKFVPAFQHIRHFKHDPNNPKSLSHNEVSTLHEDSRGNIWVGTLGGGLNRFDLKHKVFFEYKHDPNDPLSISSNSVLSIMEDHAGTIWVGTPNGLNRFDGKETFEKYTHNPRSVRGMTGNMITAILEDEPGKVWLGTANEGLNQFEEKRNVYRQFRHRPDDDNSLVHDYITCLYKDTRGQIWVGTFNGLDRITEVDSLVVFNHFQHDPADSHTISNNNIYCILEDQRNRLWIGTSNGLNLYNPEKETFRRFNIEDGLPNSVICGILEDKNGALWLSTQKGLAKFDTDKHIFYQFNLTHGLQSNMFNVGACLLTRDNRMLFGGINGFNVFEPGKIKVNTHIPPVYITAFKVFNKKMRFEKSLQHIDEIQLSYRQNFFTIEFASLDYFAPEQNEYTYILEGIDPHWYESGSKNYASYTNLDPGSYRFRVKGSNNDGIWNEEGRELEIIILPPFWMTWWFRTLSILMILLMFGTIVFDIKQRIARKSEMTRRIAELKLQALRAQMNPHFIFNTINAIQYFINFNEQKAAYTYLSLFSKLLRITLDNSEKATIPVSEEVMRLKLYLELQLLRFEDLFSYRIDIEPSIDQHNIEIPPMLIQPYVENAIKHGISALDKKGLIEISMKKSDHILECTVVDNGIGIKKSIEQKNSHKPDHNSIAMRVTEERLQILNAAHKHALSVNIVDLSEVGVGMTGTKVCIQIPI